MCLMAPRNVAGVYFRVREVLVDQFSGRHKCCPLFVGVQGGALDEVPLFVQLWSASEQRDP